MSDAAEILAAAQGVRRRLEAMPGVVRIPGEGLEAYIRANFLTDEECDALIDAIDRGRRPSGVLSDHPDPEFRTSESCDIDPHGRLARSIEAKLAALTGLHRSLGESIQGQRYAVGQQFKPHHDFFYTSEAYWQVQKEAGGQRTWTAMAFLNVPEAGGHTMFPRAKIKVTPRRGTLLLWNNLDDQGEPNMATLHQGCPVEAGVKYVITKWYREHAWTPLS